MLSINVDVGVVCYTRKNAQFVTKLQTSRSKSVYR